MSAELLPSAVLRDMVQRVRRGLPVDPEQVALVLEVADELLDVVGEVDEDVDPDLAQAAATLKRVEEERKEAVAAQAEAEEQVNAKQQEVDRLAAEKAEAERERDELLGLRAEVVELRERADRLEAQAERAARWWEQQARQRVAADVEAMQADLKAHGRARSAAEVEAARLLGVLRGIAAGPPEDAHRLARIAVGHEVIRESGTDVAEGYIPTRRERKARRAGR